MPYTWLNLRGGDGVSKRPLRTRTIPAYELEKSEIMGSPSATMLRVDIEKRLRDNLKMTMFGASAMARAILEVYFRHLVAGETIELRMVGKVESQIKAARRHHMVVETAETIRNNSRMKMTPARRILRFSPSQHLRQKMLANVLANQQEKNGTPPSP